jgi:hypothetical protein
MIDDIETQWTKWQDENPASSFMDIDDGELKERTVGAKTKNEIIQMIESL